MANIHDFWLRSKRIDGSERYSDDIVAHNMSVFEASLKEWLGSLPDWLILKPAVKLKGLLSWRQYYFQYIYHTCVSFKLIFSICF